MKWLSIFFFSLCAVRGAETVGYLLRSGEVADLAGVFEEDFQFDESGDPFSDKAEAKMEKQELRRLERRKLWRETKKHAADLAQRRSRMLEKGDETTDLTEVFRKLGYLKAETSWTVLNKVTERLVVKAEVAEHLAISEKLELLKPLERWVLDIDFYLVPDADVGLVQWSQDLLAEKKGKRCGRISLSGRSGMESRLKFSGKVLQKTSAVVKIDSSSEMDSLWSEIDLSGQVVTEKGSCKFAYQTGCVLYPQLPEFWEVGYLREMGSTLVMRCEGKVVFEDGTASNKWRVWESGKTDPLRWEIVEEESENDGEFVLWKQYTPPGVFRQEQAGQNKCADPFAASARDENEPLPFPLVKMSHDEVFGLSLDRILDVGRFFEERGVKLSQDEWIYLNLNQEMMWSRLSQKKDEMLQDLMLMTNDYPWAHGRTCFTLVQSKRKMSREILRGSGEDASQVLAKSVLDCGWGRKGVVKFSAASDKESIDCEVEPNTGADNHAFELRFSLVYKGSGAAKLEFKTGYAARIREPVIFHLSEEKGNFLALVIVGDQIDSVRDFWEKN